MLSLSLSLELGSGRKNAAATFNPMNDNLVLVRWHLTKVTLTN